MDKKSRPGSNPSPDHEKPSPPPNPPMVIPCSVPKATEPSFTCWYSKHRVVKNNEL